MVDAINSYSGVKPQDLTINWNDCTANEVLEYKDEGQEVPTAILAWAEDMSKQQGADEVTYEMAMDLSLIHIFHCSALPFTGNDKRCQKNSD